MILDGEDSERVADTNLAKDLAEQMRVAACERRERVMPLDPKTTIGVLVAAMKIFVESVEEIYPQPDLDRRPPCIVFKLRR